VPWAAAGKAAQALVIAAAAVVVVGYGVYSYFVPSITRIGFSVYQVSAVLAAMAVFVAIDIPLLRGAKEIGAIRWGQIPARAQYALFFLAVSFTWLMGLMGYIRSGIRQYWHIYGRVMDESANAYTMTHGHATIIVSCIVVVFFLLVSVVFWLAARNDPPPAPRPAGGGDGSSAADAASMSLAAASLGRPGGSGARGSAA
jgi:hypothetical protein